MKKNDIKKIEAVVIAGMLLSIVFTVAVSAVLNGPPAINPPEQVYGRPPINMRGQNCPPNPAPPPIPPLTPQPPINGEKDDGWHHNLLWSDKPSLGYWGSGVTVDSEDNVISVGEGVVDASAYIIKYDENGEKLWEDTLEAETIFNEVPVEVEPNGDQYPFAKGTIPNPEWYMNESAKEKILHLFDMDNVKIVGGYGFNFKGVCVDSDDNIIATGYLIIDVAIGEGGLPFLCILVYTTKYSPDGTQLWEKLHFFQLLNFGVSIDVDSNNNVFIAAVTSGFAGGSLLGSCGWTIKIDSEGHKLGSFLYWLIDGDTWAYVMPWRLKVDSDDHIWVAGDLIAWGGPRDGWDEDQDVYVLEYTINGLLLNEWEFDRGEDMYEDVYGLSLDTEGNVILTGTLASQQGYDEFGGCYTSNERAYVAKFDEHGTLLWLKEDRNVYVYRAVASGCTIAGFESVVATSFLDGQFTFYIYNCSDGQLRHWFSKGTAKPEEAQSVTFDSKNNIVATGVSSQWIIPENMYTMKVNVTFSLLENEPL